MKDLLETLYYLQNNDKNGNYMEILEEIEEGVLTVTEAKNECVEILERWLDENIEGKNFIARHQINEIINIIK